MEADEYKLMASVEEEHWWWRARREILAEVIAHHAPKRPRQLKIVEVGCGTGGNLPMLARFGDVMGAEREPAALAHLREKHGQRFRAISHSVPAPLPGPFDILGMFDVLEHIADDRQALTWAATQLAPGGIAVLTVPAFPFLWSEHDEAAHHFRRYTADTFRGVVPPALHITHLTAFNTLLFPAIAAVRTVQRYLPNGRAQQSRRERPFRSSVTATPRALNWLLYRLFRLERHLVPRRRSPIGVSLLAVLRRVPD